MRISVVCDNTAGALSGTLGEHGFAAVIESGGETVLFDTGQGETLLPNCRRMNRDLSRVEKVVLSHGHYDHTGGLWPLLRSCGGKEIHAHPLVFERRYRRTDRGEAIAIGIPYREDFLRGLGGRFVLSEEPREIAPGLVVTGAIPRHTPPARGDAGLVCDVEGCLPDIVADEQAVAAVTPKGLVVITGCCHAGLINTLRRCREVTGVERVYAVVGGTHLSFIGEEQLEDTVRELREAGVDRIAAGHCTGFVAASRLHREFPGKFHPAQVGYTIEVREEP